MRRIEYPELSWWATSGPAASLKVHIESDLKRKNDSKYDIEARDPKAECDLHTSDQFVELAQRRPRSLSTEEGDREGESSKAGEMSVLHLCTTMLGAVVNY